MKYLLTLLCLAAGLAFIRAAAAQDEMEAAKEHFGKGVEYFNKGDYGEALKEFKVSYKLKPHWKIRFNVGMCYYELKRHVEAAREISKFLEEGGSDIPAKQQDKAKEILSEAKKNVGIIKFSGDMESTLVKVDGEEVTELEMGQQIFTEPGRHAIFVQYKDQVILDEEITLDAGTAREIVTTVVQSGEGEEAEVKVEEAGTEEGALPEVPDGAWKKQRYAAYGLLAGAAATLVVGAVLGGLVFKEKGLMEDAEDAYMEEFDGARDPDELARLEKEQGDHYDTARGYAMGANILIPLGGALAVTSIVLFAVSARKKKKESRPLSVSLLPGPASLSLHATW
jgi:hypothetical protein